MITASSIASDVERGLAIREEMETLKTRLEAIEERLKQAGIESPHLHEELNDPEREGRQFKAAGLMHIVPVVFTADLLSKSFKDASPRHLLLKSFAGDKLPDFFAKPVTWESKFDSGKKFRAHAMEVLGAKAPLFISACVQRDKAGIAKSAIKVDWDRAESLGRGPQ